MSFTQSHGRCCHIKFLMHLAAKLHGQDLALNAATPSSLVTPHVSPLYLYLSILLLAFGNFRTILREDICQILAL